MQEEYCFTMVAVILTSALLTLASRDDILATDGTEAK